MKIITYEKNILTITDDDTQKKVLIKSNKKIKKIIAENPLLKSLNDAQTKSVFIDNVYGIEHEKAS